MPFELKRDLDQRKQENLFRSVRIAQTAQAPVMEVEGRALLTFCSNDYLGLANHPDVIKSFQKAANEFGVGSGASHLVNGHSYFHQKLEEKIAKWTGRESVLLFSTGYMANLGAINGLLNKEDAIFQDKLNHASLLDAGLLSGARFQRYLHNDVNNLKKRLARCTERRRLIVTDGVFSMDGDQAPISELVTLSQEYDAWVMVDDAHGLGVLGDSGAGICEAQNLDQDAVPVLMGTLGKAVGTAGAFVAGSQTLIDYLTNFARSYVYTTAMPPAVAAASITSINIIQTEHSRRANLHERIKQFRQGAKSLGLNLMDSHTAIQPIIVGDASTALQMSEKLLNKGILVSAIRPPTVPNGTARLRVTLSASHTEQQVNQLLEALDQTSADKLQFGGKAS